MKRTILEDPRVQDAVYEAFLKWPRADAAWEAAKVKVAVCGLIALKAAPCDSNAMTREAPGELGKMQWDAAAARSAIENLPPEAALAVARDAFTSILKRIEGLNDRYYPIKPAGVEGVRRNEGLLGTLDSAERRQVDIDREPVAARLPINGDNDASDNLDAINDPQCIGLNQDVYAVPDRADVVPFFERRLDRIFGRR